MTDDIEERAVLDVPDASGTAGVPVGIAHGARVPRVRRTRGRGARAAGGLVG